MQRTVVPSAFEQACKARSADLLEHGLMPEPADQPLLSAAAMLGDQIERLPKRAVVVFDESHVPRRKRRRKPAPFRQVAVLDSGGVDTSVAVVATVGPGGPTAAVTVEFLAYLGVEAIVSVGVAGDLSGSRPGATVFPVSASVAEDGTSARYGSRLTPSSGLLSALTAAVNEPSVVAVSTDTPFRHTEADIIRFRESARLIEMETATLFAVANHCGLAAGALLVSSDGYEDTEQGMRWTAGDQRQISPAVTAAVATAVEVLGGYPVRSDGSP
jgi:uridine phosphorylase